MANSIARLLSQLRIPVPVLLGGTGKTTIAAFLADLLTAGAYGKTNVTTAVQDTGGVPSGGVVSSYLSGGVYVVKWADGTMEMSGQLNAVCVAANTYYNATVTLPEGFNLTTIPAPRGSWCINSSNAGVTSGVLFINVSAPTVLALQWAFNQVSTQLCSWTVKGRWKA